MTIESSDCLICYLDILGYKKIVNFSQEGTHRKIFKIMEEILQQFRLQKSSQSIDAILRAIDIQVVSDSILLALDISNPPGDLEPETEKQFVCAYVFFQVVAWFSLKILHKLNHYVRGGIANGQHFQSSLIDSKNQFIFSKALVQSVELEKIANFPRILITDTLYKFLVDRQSDLFEELFLRDADGLRYLDLYNVFFGNSGEPLYPSEDTFLRELLVRIRTPLEENVPKVLQKYYWFQTYHNCKIDEYAKRNRLQKPNTLLIKKPDSVLTACNRKIGT
ncbi:MAG: hypothetical protein A3G33_07880 [Omnitrophica bacterium RIFCSPLOWO2_12_FULL_44_17]|uniref:Guanylate cyclase domain-containing protein n=1 Tax=Candidatus Danuiimicrobium aquiferis TaxID=1801832 RepID=A0A1G1L2Y4_9BACT|nr:MAG: hypothetical protein A3B72_05665 [Omnitrophica bacterium RIFCSPHIGHO2_02_FULL_45_28]OGW92432.1 MAG: hypothetical protein A3E74_04100 [Omnitrophica bacterium RIFCSPHIGHO2_12_FULL_44_12]OGW99521.1 MAG: hypothetical protein A3G33_07880 [Omnitrophica bacterium RIFCSPLOWO2_12_FULL_44_17]OGX02693.1 MAG: hypothetical protein A3J12_06875 [Omnitrophica bacterium RIFCSPLOWO2_02_FULL_44_11]